METNTYCVYILRSQKDESLYVGSSADPFDRLAKHNRPHKGYSASKQPWSLVFIQWFGSKTLAIQTERKFKARKKREFLERLIASPDNELLGNV